MPQVFHRSFNTISKVSIFGAVFFLAFIGWLLSVVYRSAWITDERHAYVQPVPFSHAHHAGQLGIDCRYCHTSVEDSSFAGIPPTKTCMNCHQQIWVGSPVLEPVRASYRTDESIPWERIHNLPGFVYFDHSIHVNKGVGCVTCHGQVNEMPLTWQHGSLLMEWCLDCHRDPAQHVRPRDQVFSMTWRPEDDGTTQAELGPRLVKEYNIRTSANGYRDSAHPDAGKVNPLTSCSTCHR
ncbi:MAG TPA: cytochrome c3 family protein [Gemmataceae bacterium]|nr:cytochrome c3 family protein [Gemmataceae bacterium]